MLLHEHGEGVVCIGQAAHSWVSGQLARRWGNERFAAPDPLEEVCLGAVQHDIGMAEWDLRPALDPDTGWPLPFTRMPLATHLALWRAAPEKILTQSPYAALLVSMHGHALYASRDPGEPNTEESRAVAAYLAEQEALHGELIERVGEDRARAGRNQRLVWALDYLALAAVMGWVPKSMPAPDEEVTVEAAGGLGVTVDPWPFDRPGISLTYPGRLLTERSRTQEELDGRLAAARWVEVPVTWTQR